MCGDRRIHDSPMSEPVSKQVAVLRRALRPYPGTGSCAGRRCRRIFGLYDKEFDKTIAEFAMPYADQTKRDWRAPGCDQKGAPGRRGATRFANLTPQRLGSAKSRTPDLSDPGAALGTDA
jgi:hypothetical protein